MLLQHIYTKILKGFKILEGYMIYQENCSIILKKSLYKLKQFGHIWYNHINEYLLKEGYKNNSICLCVIIKRT